MIKIRKATIKDAAELVNMYQTNLLDVDKFLPDLDRFIWDIQDEKDNIKGHQKGKGLYLVALIDGQIVGNLILSVGEYQKNEHCGSIGLSVRREFRGRGVGSKLMNELINWAKKHKIKRLELEVWSNNQSAIKLYKKFGFKVEGRKRKAYKIGNKYVDGVMMAKLSIF